MSDVNELSAQLAAINVVASTELVEKVGSTYELGRLQSQLNDSRNRVESVKSLLVNTQPHELTVEAANFIDNQLNAVGALQVDGTTVQGVESLGYTLMPKQYIESRLQGCEGFLSGWGAKSAFIAKQIAAAFKDAWILLRESNDSLLSRLDELEKDVLAAGEFPAGTSDILLGFRLFNLFQINHEVKEDWIAQLTKVSKTINGLSSNYYVSSKNHLNTTMSYFGGFTSLDEQKAAERYLMLPVSIPSVRFKECTIQDRTWPQKGIAAFRSVELMGGRFFLDTRTINRNLEPKIPEEVNEYLHQYLENDRTFFNGKPDKEYNDVKETVKTLGSDQIKQIVKLARTTLKDWEKVYVDGEKHKLVDRDYEGIMKELFDADWNDDLRHYVTNAFNSVVTKNQQELIEVRAKVNNYLVFLINGITELCYTSIQLNQE
ncbi:hypothetical protein AVA65_08195 [Salmonella enterica subsp. enterica serovar Minnesota]|nr:hypothetical protein [Salmonella enterica subsp. enterica serovar Minnesota]